MGAIALSPATACAAPVSSAASRRFARRLPSSSPMLHPAGIRGAVSLKVLDTTRTKSRSVTRRPASAAADPSPSGDGSSGGAASPDTSKDRSQTADVVIIGSGIGGLCCGALLARYGLDVVVCESHYLPGDALRNAAMWCLHHKAIHRQSMIRTSD